MSVQPLYYFDTTGYNRQGMQQPGMQQQRGGGMNLNMMSELMEMFGGGGGSAGSGAEMGEFGAFSDAFGAGAGGEGGGMMSNIGSWGPTAGYVAAAILGQHLLSNKTGTEFEGVKTDDAFGGHFMTEPWLAFLYDKIGLNASPGERFDAAVENKDWGTAAKRLPAAGGYWADPLGAMGADLTENVFGDTGSNIIQMLLNPAQGIARLIEDIF